MSFAIKIFKNSIYNEEDCRFSFNDEASFMKLIDVICKIEINEDFVDAFATSYGDVHEAFREYGGGKGSKELGQFFSPRHLINIIFHMHRIYPDKSLDLDLHMHVRIYTCILVLVHARACNYIICRRTRV